MTYVPYVVSACLMLCPITSGAIEPTELCFRTESPANAVALSPSSRLLAVAEKDGTVSVRHNGSGRVFEISKSVAPQKLQRIGVVTSSLSFSADEKYLAVATGFELRLLAIDIGMDRGSVRRTTSVDECLWIPTMVRFDPTCSALAWTSRKTTFYTVPDQPRTLNVVDIASALNGQSGADRDNDASVEANTTADAVVMPVVSDDTWSVDISANSRLVAVSGQRDFVSKHDNAIQREWFADVFGTGNGTNVLHVVSADSLWVHWTSSERLAVLRVPGYCPSERSEGVDSVECVMELWSIDDRKVAGRYAFNAKGVHGVSFSHQGAYCGVAASKGKIYLFSTREGRVVADLQCGDRPIDSLTVGNDRSVYIGSTDGVYKVSSASR